MSTTSPQKTTRRRILGLSAAAVLGLTAAAVSSAPATATITDTDRPRVQASRVDFGQNWWVSAPQNGGYLYWDYDNGQVTPIVEGYLYLTDRECGRVHVEYYDENHVFLGHRNSGTECAPGNGKTQWWKELDSFSHSDVHHVHVEVERQVNGGYAYVDGNDYDYD